MRGSANSEAKEYLRVLTPQTIDGTTLKYNSLTSKVVYKETTLPLTARKHIELENESRPDHLKHKIEVVVSDAKPPKPRSKEKEPEMLKEGEDDDTLGEEKEEEKRRGPGRPKTKEAETV